MTVLDGLSQVARSTPETQKLLRGRRVGLLAHPASVDSELRHAEALLPEVGAKLSAIFGPEHGYSGQAQYMVGVASTAGAVPVYSLYGDTFEDLSPTPEQLRGLDAVVVDLQDVGSRYYTFVWSMALMLRACAKAGIQCIVLDRPNPLGGVVMEGAPQRPGYRSFVGLYDVPVRHGLSIGELARMVQELEQLPADVLAVVPMLGYRRELDFHATGLPWVLPSPNMPTPETARVYPGGCLLEGTNLSEGRGTTRPFELFGAPFIDGGALARALAATPEARGACLRPLQFEPTFHKFARETCGGVQVHVRDADSFRSYPLYLRAIAHVCQSAPEAFAFRTEPYEYVSDRPAIDLLTGGPEFREVASSASALDDYLHAQARPLREFAERRRGWLLY
ncbi:MAG: hypothetical protein JWN48_1204 [Myxococcaceae bacterium]|nr:hypothetical protein [Myxococcaceae bacterium]